LTAGPAGRVAIITTNLASLGLAAASDKGDLAGRSSSALNPSAASQSGGGSLGSHPPPGHE